MKTTKEEQSLIRMALNNLQGQSQEDFIISILEKRFSVSDVEQLQKELKDEVNGIIMSELSRDRIQYRIDEVFNNFKVSELPSNSEHVQKPNVSDRK